MSASSSIEWTDATWNPVRGCKWASSGCDHCYAETFVDAPARWARPRTVFANSMSDLFQADVPEAYAEACFEVMRLANWHTYQVLTKRAARMRAQVQRMPEQLRAMPRASHGHVAADSAGRDRALARGARRRR